jgi:hypothetical protein
MALLKLLHTPGVSEFLSALLGGGVTMAAQFLALRHDREKEAKRQTNKKKAQAWSIYFKISQAHEALTATAAKLREHRANASEHGWELWQSLQFPPHDWNTVTWDIGELVLLIDNKRFELMQRYQEAMWWLSNLTQSVRYYREMRFEFVTKMPSSVDGDGGSFEVTPENHTSIMPTIVHLKSLSESMEAVILKQAPDARKLLIDYVAAMEEMVGTKPSIQFVVEQ